ncbi:MAG: FAD binding domain-containing protein [Saprospiraceae bacterium]|jgi:4-hydroxybenzoyl-CoA reductase subunit beta|nr:FAD binding domain-containing protein [Saprospiraceae bacterium]MBP9209322.1 FAD binding domain-containing protein [Saprospiraceae bacterium]MBV6474270.1 4-hydroxybenzoyl-CoA reductase subunit beta [Saprospiraceae bacterium]
MQTDMDIPKQYLKPRSVEEALRMASGCISPFKFIAGGTDLMVHMKQGNESANILIDISGLEELKQIALEPGGVLRIGSLACLESIAQNALVREHFPVLAEAIETVASPVLRKSATIGGNLLCENRCSFYDQSEWWRQAVGYCLKCNGDTCIATGGKKNCYSKFSSDLAVVLISLDARVTGTGELFSKGLPLENIYTGDGVHPRKVRDGIMLLSVELAVDRKFRSVYNKLRPRRSMDFSSLTSAVSIDAQGGINIVLGGVDPMPVVARGNIHQSDELAVRAYKRSRVVDNDHYSRSYRKRMISVFVKRSFEQLGIDQDAPQS